VRRAFAVALGAVLLVTASCGTPTAGLSSEQQELAAYLSSMYRLQGEQLEAMADITIGTADLGFGGTEEEMLAQQQQASQDLVAAVTDFAAALQLIDPPPSAAELHTELIASSESIAENSAPILEDLAGGDIEVMLQAQQELTALLAETIADSQVLAEELAAMVEDVLAGRDDPETRYILELLELRSSETLDQVQTLLEEVDPAAVTSPEQFANLIDQVIALFETARAEYAAITPPEQWASLHAEQIALLDDGIALYSRFDEVFTALFEDPESVDLEEIETFFGDLLEWAARSPALNAAMAHQLADYFEALSGA
jgi:hypothetical protein